MRKKLDTEHLNNLSKVTIWVTPGGRICILAVLIPETVRTISVFTYESSVLQVEGLESMRDAKWTKSLRKHQYWKGGQKKRKEKAEDRSMEARGKESFQEELFNSVTWCTYSRRQNLTPGSPVTLLRESKFPKRLGQGCIELRRKWDKVGELQRAELWKEWRLRRLLEEYIWGVCFVIQIKGF